MNGKARKFPDWLLALAFVALATAFVALDPFALDTRFARLEFHFFRQLAPPGDVAKTVNSVAAQILFLEIFGAALAILMARRRMFWAFAVVILAVAAAQGASWLLYAHEGVLLGSATASAGLLAALCAGAVGALLQNAHARRRVEVPQPLRPNGGRSLYPAIDQRLVASLSCGLRRRPEIAATFAGDAAGFVRYAEAALAPLLDEAVRRGATIGDYDGTGFAAHWEAALHGPHFADAACDAAECMVAAVAKLNDGLTREHANSAANLVEIGIGLSAGPAIVGSVRAQGRIANCVAGAGAGMAERLEHLSARYGPAVLASSHIRDSAQRAHAFLEVDYLSFEPPSEPVTLYALLGNPLLAASPKFRAVATFHEHIFRALRGRDWEKARALVAQCRKLSGVSDTVYDLQLARIAWFESHPPPPEWDGAFRPVVR